MVTDEHVARKYLSLINSADERKLEFNLSLTDVRKLLNQKLCYYTGVALKETRTDYSDPHVRTFDRVDNTKGYVKGNVVACTYEVNQFKGSMSLIEIEKLNRTLSLLQNGIDKLQINNFTKEVNRLSKKINSKSK